MTRTKKTTRIKMLQRQQNLQQKDSSKCGVITNEEGRNKLESDQNAEKEHKIFLQGEKKEGCCTEKDHPSGEK